VGQLGAPRAGHRHGAGVLLALHFWSWNTSVALTTVAASVVLVNTQPVIVALLSMVWLREPPARRQWLGIALAMAGALIVALPDLAHPSDSRGHPHALLGDLLALVGAITAAVYFVVGRRLRKSLDLWPYVGLVYGSCFVALLVLAPRRTLPWCLSRHGSWRSSPRWRLARCSSDTRGSTGR
jgi:Permeases of the drug/metabolite transporter (DMT) superfamily